MKAIKRYCYVQYNRDSENCEFNFLIEKVKLITFSKNSNPLPVAGWGTQGRSQGGRGQVGIFLQIDLLLKFTSQTVIISNFQTVLCALF